MVSTRVTRTYAIRQLAVGTRNGTWGAFNIIYSLQFIQYIVANQTDRNTFIQSKVIK